MTVEFEEKGEDERRERAKDKETITGERRKEEGGIMFVSITRFKAVA